VYRVREPTCGGPKVKPRMPAPKLKPSGGKITKALLTPSGLQPTTGGSIIPSGYGFVVLTAVGSVALITWKSAKVLNHSFPRDCSQDLIIKYINN